MNKKVIIVIGAIAGLGIGYYIYSTFFKKQISQEITKSEQEQSRNPLETLKYTDLSLKQFIYFVQKDTPTPKVNHVPPDYISFPKNIDYITQDSKTSEVTLKPNVVIFRLVG